MERRSRAAARWLAALLPLFVATTAWAEVKPAADAIEGDWLVDSRDAVIHIARHGDHYEGNIRWQLHDTYGAEDGPALQGKVVTDVHNPDPGLRQRPLTGLRLLSNLSYAAADDKWTGGRIYDSDDGRTYNCWVKLLDPNRLKLHGYIGISLLGGSTVWHRVDMQADPHSGLPFTMVAPDE